ncbi:phosphoglycerate kinase [Candidatus Falkowbacteria bacterium]|nr:phosphoglycerate kinase [Candidatus Falkowbacteria bacterium]
MKSIASLKGKIHGKRVLVRVDYNVEIVNGRIVDKEKIIRTLATIKFLRSQGAVVLLMTHLGRPDGKRVKQFSTKQFISLLKKELSLLWLGDLNDKSPKVVSVLKPGQVGIFENLRFNPLEELNGSRLITQMKNVADVFVNDGFSVSHRKHASVYGIATKLPSFAGFALISELEAIAHTKRYMKCPSVAIIGGAKVSTKFKVIDSLCKRFDHVLIGGAMANTFYGALGYHMGASLVEKKFYKQSLSLLKKYAARIILPIDLVGRGEGKKWEALDIGPATQKLFTSYIAIADTLLWNGPLGKFEEKKFAKGTHVIAKALAQRSLGHAYGIVGGGETLTVVNKLKLSHSFDFVSTGGGALLEYLENPALPGLVVLR